MFIKRVVIVCVIILLGDESGAARVRKQGPKNYKNYNHILRGNTSSSNTGLWPSVFNLATKALISANATCGEGGREEFCRMTENGRGRCGICDNFSSDPGKKHPISYAIDGTNKWWQSPALHYGSGYEHVSIVVDLKQVYQITHVIIKAATSPRPGAWILERSFDAETYEPWQYFARNDKECAERFGLVATKGKPHYFTDSEVICTSFYSRLTPLENGEIHTSLVNGRPGAAERSPELLEFTKARYVRLRLMGLRGTMEPLPRGFSQDISRDKRLYYTIKDINIGGHCVCNGHGENCRHSVASGHPDCECSHHTCGPNCEKCCPLFNQRQWGAGTSRDARQCLPCNCHGHATSCHYEEDVDKAGVSMDINGNYQGGGVCDNCTAHTSGINCERCQPGFYRPWGTPRDAPKPCVQCACNPDGSSGFCVQEGVEAGRCECLSGYTGKSCEVCAGGYRGWPRCEPCPCNAKGSVMAGVECEGECKCKANVEGKFCDRCKSGFFGLSDANPEGCVQCFCSDVTTLCEAATASPPKPIQTLNDWLITDLKIRETVKPAYDDKGLFSIGNYELPEVESLFWLAPPAYRGNKLEYYALNFTFKVHWVIMRGDTSGKPTNGPNLILVGSNGLKIAHGDDFFTTSNTTLTILMSEHNWYHISSDMDDIVTRLKRNGYVGEPVNRRQFLSVLADIRYILLRATFHTDQIEALLEEAVLNSGSSEVKREVERCACPSGYAGLSCESCAFGHVRIMANASAGLLSNGIVLEQGFCGKCDCNGHSDTCNPDTGECFCAHNTIGETCERCAAGFYGNPLRGTVTDCKKCACPLENDANNFSPSCQVDYFADGQEEGGYVCTQCPKGYTGDHCEICDDGYYGDPMEIGNRCTKCNCNGGPCDRVTGQCLGCKGNTEGWRCERCKPGYYGDASSSNCKSCQCDPIGSLSKACDNTTGQCECKARFTDLTCDKCQAGYGNVTALCTPCACDPIGSKSDVCDPHTGLCSCQKGVEGFHCDACQNLHYGFSAQGCEPCNCDPDGSQFPSCDLKYGQCICKEHFTGQRCNTCEDLYYKRNKNCVACNCDRDGSQDLICQQDGLCTCKPGVDGPKCTICKENHYGNVTIGCKECDSCKKKGHICDQKTGKCACPPRTTGPHCEKCEPHAWSYEPGIGCQACGCSPEGSSSPQCDNEGKCACKIGYEGKHCDQCNSLNFYGYPNCRECKCNVAGTLSDDCTDDLCRCTEAGCRCKANVQGKRCDSCKNGTFGLDAKNANGCTACFCFRRSKTCTQSELKWDLVRTKQFGDEAACPNGGYCRTLPPKFLGDLTLSRSGLLRIEAADNLPRTIYVTGNGVTIATTATKQVEIRETEWHVFDDPKSKLPTTCVTKLSSDCFLAVLQNVAKIEIEAKDQLNEVLLDRAIDTFSLPRKLPFIERCECPEMYTSPSCQDPNDGYYRHYPSKSESDSFIERMIGVARPCPCNGRSKQCDKETGKCLNCTDFTKGDQCELCADGYYKNKTGDCSACLCPSKSKNFAKSCALTENGDFKCNCRLGYSGAKCNQCDNKYWGNPHETNGLCQKCDCNPHGSTNQVCDKVTGVCECKPGFTGNQCSQCQSPRQVIHNGVCTPCDECTQILFNTIDALSSNLQSTHDLFKDGIGPPWPTLNETLQHVNLLSSDFDRNVKKANELIKKSDIPSLENSLDRMKKDLSSKDKQLRSHLTTLAEQEEQATKASKEIDEISRKIDEMLANLDGFGHSHVDARDALKTARAILAEINAKGRQVKSAREYEKFFEECRRLMREVEEVYLRAELNPGEIKAALNGLKERISKLNALLDHTETMNKLTRSKNKLNSQRVAALAAQIGAINKNASGARHEIGEIRGKLNATSGILEDIHAIYVNLSRVNFERLNNALDGGDYGEPEYYETIGAVIEHVKDLEGKIKRYNNLVNFTKEEWKKINGSGAYESLVKGIQEARRTAEEANDVMVKTMKLINPEGNDTLIDATNIAKAFSDRIQKRVINLKNLTNQIEKLRAELEKLNYEIKNNGRDNNHLIAMLDNMKQQIQSQNFDDLKRVIKDSKDVIENVNSIARNVTDLAKSKELSKMYEKYLNLTASNDINKLLNNVTLTQLELNYLNLNETLLDRIRKINRDKVENKDENLNRVRNLISNLKNSVKNAKDTVESIDIGISMANCTRSYKFDENSNNDILTSLKIVYNCTTRCTLFHLKQDNESLLEISVKSNKIRVKWRQEPLEIFDISSAMKNFSSISLEHLEDIVTIKSGDTVKTIHNKEIMMLHDAKFTISGKTGEIKNSIQTIEINEEKVGLWKFITSTGECKGIAPSLPTESEQKTYFNGAGYKNITDFNDMKPNQIDLFFTFSTFDENSLIFLAKDKTASYCSYMMLSLQNGSLFFKVLHNDDSQWETFRSNKKYNNGKSIRVNLKMQHSNGKQTYILEAMNESPQSLFNLTKPLRPKNVFKIKKSDIFIGGLAPGFDRACIMEDTTSFLGYLNARLAKQDVPANSQKIRAFGTSQRYGELEFKKALFLGDGFLKLSVNLSTVSSLSFIIKSWKNVTNACVIHIENYIDVYIKDRKLGVRLANDEKQTVEIKEDLPVIALVQITISPSGILLELDEFNASVEIAPLRDPDTNYILLGQDPDHVLPNFEGIIQQLAINNKIVALNASTVQEFYSVSIGRDRTFSDGPIVAKNLPIGAIIENNSIKDMQNTEGCPQVGNYETDPEAVNFGDKSNSFIYIENNFWKKDYVLQFKFRAFYPNGLLYIAIGNSQQKHYNVFEIHEGRLRLRIKGKRMKKIDLPDKVNDGEWHSVQITQTGLKRKRKLSIMLDERINRSMKIPKNNIKGEIYFGGVPEYFPEFPDLRNHLYQFRGCMSSLKINQLPQVLVKNKKNVVYNNIGQCFRHVEKGAYFGGDAFAIYKSDFRVNKILELSFEFRTIEQNGILLSVSNLGNSPALSVELQNGAVVMTIDMGNGAVSNVTNSLDSDFTLCNNRWHNITALYSSFELTVNVDGIRKSWVQSDVNSLMDDIEAPLYVGGIPDNAPSGTLKIKENFKGCVRNLKIEDNIMDWTDMKELHNVLLNACPVRVN